MKKIKLLMILMLLIVPISFVACSNENRDTMQMPTNLTVETGGLITFERVENEGYYTILIDETEFNVFTNNSNVQLFSENGKNYLQYDASKIFILGESYTVRVKARADGKRDSSYTSVVSYTHTIPMAKPTNIQINGTVLTWDVVENASLYFVRVLTPTDNVSADDSETIANAELTTYQFSTNRFDFSSILNSAGTYKFYINALSNDSNYTESGYTSKVTYRNEIQLATPTNSQIYIVNELDTNQGTYVDNFHLIAVIDTNANGITIQAGEYKKSVELNGTESSVKQTENLLDINLNQFFKDVYVDGKLIDFSEIKQYSFQIQANYLTMNEQDKYYLDSNFSEDILIENYKKLDAPKIELKYDELSNCYVANWSVDNIDFISGYKVYIATDTGVNIYELSKNNTSIMLPTTFISVSVQAIGQGNYLNSNLSEQKSNFSEQITDNISAEINANTLIWDGVDDAYYILEIDNQIIVQEENTFNLLSVDIVDEMILTIVKSNFAPKTINVELTYSKQLATPTIASNQGFQENNPYVLTFTGVDNAIGYYVYLTGINNSEPARIQEIFTSTTIDLSKYIIKQGMYRDYYVQIQAVASPYSGYTDSELTEFGTLTVSHTRILDVPMFLRDDSGTITPVVRRNVNGITNYFLCFYGVEYAYRYEVMVNFNTINVVSNGTTDLYEINITNYLTSANSYTIMVRALPNPLSEENIKASNYNSYDYVLTMQLDEVTNIRITENDGRYTLSFDIQENADSYRVRIVKLNDGNYTNYLYDLGLANPFEVVQSTDITDYVVQAGEYYVYVTALAGKDSFYGDSNESQNYGVLNKLSTLNTPSEIQFSNQSADSYLIRWVGDENADYYTIKVTDTNGISREYKAYNTTQYNINPSITLEGNYAVSIKAVVDSTSENAIEYTSSPFSEEVYLYYTYTQPHDFERYSVYMYGEYYDFSVSTVQELMNLLWYHYLFGINPDLDLGIYLNVNEGESVRNAIIRLADEANSIYNFNNDGEWLNLISSGTDSALFGYMARALLSLYPEMAVLKNFEITHEDNSQIFRLYYENALEVEKVDTESTFIQIPTDYGNDYEYLDIYSRRSDNSLFAIDSLPEMDVSTTEQLLMAVQYGRKPNFVGDSETAQLVYENAKDVLRTIINNNMSDLEKVTEIFDWLEYAYNLNYYSNRVLSDNVLVEGTLAEYGNRKEYYLEGIFLDIHNTEIGGYDGEFYLGNKNATSESFAKAFTLLCGIEGIETRKVNGTFTYMLEGQYVTTPHAWNKVYIDTSSDGDNPTWYSLDITYSDNRFVPYNYRECYNYSSHLYFLVTDTFLNLNLNLTQDSHINYPSANSYYDYYANTSFAMTVDDINNTIVGAGDNIADFEYSMEFVDNSENNYQLYALTAEYSQLQAFVMNSIMYAKNLMLYENTSSRSSFEFRVSNSAIGGATLPSNATIQSIMQTINQYYSYLDEQTQTNVHYVQDTNTGMTTYVFTLEIS